MDAHEGQAAWAQAIGSVLAIAVSAGFALWIPLHMRSSQDRAEALRARRGIYGAIELLLGSLEGIRQIAAAQKVSDATLRLQEVNVRNIRILLDSLPRFVLGPAALAIINDVDAKTVVLDSILKAAHGPRGEATELPFEDVRRELEENYAITARMRAARIEGDWTLELPE